MKRKLGKITLQKAKTCKDRYLLSNSNSNDLNRLNKIADKKIMSYTSFLPSKKGK